MIYHFVVLIVPIVMIINMALLMGILNGLAVIWVTLSKMTIEIIETKFVDVCSNSSQYCYLTTTEPRRVRTMGHLPAVLFWWSRCFGCVSMVCKKCILQGPSSKQQKRESTLGADHGLRAVRQLPVIGVEDRREARGARGELRAVLLRVLGLVSSSGPGPTSASALPFAGVATM